MITGLRAPRIMIIGEYLDLMKQIVNGLHAATILTIAYDCPEAISLYNELNERDECPDVIVISELEGRDNLLDFVRGLVQGGFPNQIIAATLDAGVNNSLMQAGCTHQYDSPDGRMEGVENVVFEALGMTEEANPDAPDTSGNAKETQAFTSRGDDNTYMELAIGNDDQ